MRRTQILATVAVTGILATTSATAVSHPSASSFDPTARTVLSFVYSEPFGGGRTKYLDLGKPGLGPGDMFFVTGVPMLSEETGKRIGLEDGTETVASARHHGTVEMNMTLRLTDGLVMLAGVVRHTDKPFRLPVVGGTGAYANATGQMSVLREDRHRKVSVIQVDLQF